MRKPRKMTRKEFESRIAGNWKEGRSQKRGSYRTNGKYFTAVRDGKKLFSDDTATIAAGTWDKLWRVIDGKRTGA